MYKEMLDNYDKQRAEMKKDSAASITPAVAYNQQLIAKYDGALNAIATEMSCIWASASVPFSAATRR